MAKHKRVHRDWPAVVQAYTASGLSVTAFCREQGISTSLLYRWRQRIPGKRQRRWLAALSSCARWSTEPRGRGWRY